jgi:hypothetical protein
MINCLLCFSTGDFRIGRSASQPKELQLTRQPPPSAGRRARQVREA